MCGCMDEWIDRWAWTLNFVPFNISRIDVGCYWVGESGRWEWIDGVGVCGYGWGRYVDGLIEGWMDDWIDR